MKPISPFARSLIGGALLGSIGGIFLVKYFHIDSESVKPSAVLALIGFYGAVLGALAGAIWGVISRQTAKPRRVLLAVGLILLGIFLAPLFSRIPCTLGLALEENKSELSAPVK